jgi:hypothetical protein
VRVKVTCPRSESLCRITVRIRNSAGSTLGSTRRFSLAGGKSRTLRVGISRRARALLRLRHRLAIRLVVRATDAAGNSKTLTKRLALKG